MNVYVEAIYICVPLGDRPNYMILMSDEFSAYLGLTEMSDTHALYMSALVQEQVSVDTILSLRWYHSHYSYSTTVFYLSDLVRGCHHSKHLFPNKVTTSTYTMSISRDDYTIEVHYKIEDDV